MGPSSSRSSRDGPRCSSLPILRFLGFSDVDPLSIYLHAKTTKRAIRRPVVFPILKPETRLVPRADNIFPGESAPIQRPSLMGADIAHSAISTLTVDQARVNEVNSSDGQHRSRRYLPNPRHLHVFGHERKGPSREYMRISGGTPRKPSAPARKQFPGNRGSAPPDACDIGRQGTGQLPQHGNRGSAFLDALARLSHVGHPLTWLLGWPNALPRHRIFTFNQCRNRTASSLSVLEEKKSRG